MPAVADANADSSADIDADTADAGATWAALLGPDCTPLAEKHRGIREAVYVREAQWRETIFGYYVRAGAMVEQEAHGGTFCLFVTVAGAVLQQVEERRIALAVLLVCICAVVEKEAQGGNSHNTCRLTAKNIAERIAHMCTAAQQKASQVGVRKT